MSATPAPMIEVRNLMVRYGKFQAVDDVSFEVARGDCVVICGPSGSGKSTLLRCINALEPFQGGSVVVDGVDVATCPDLPGLRSHVGMVFQHFELYPHMSVLDNITLALRKVQGMARAAAEERGLDYLGRVGIANQARKFPAELSGGQQQRAAIARGLALEPKVMMFDEPTSALDPEMIAEVLAVMRDLAKGGMTMLVVTHEMGFAEEVADEILFMNHGQLVERGKAAEFFRNPRSERAREFLDKVLRRRA